MHKITSDIFEINVVFDPYQNASTSIDGFSLINIKDVANQLNIGANDTQAISNLQKIIKSATIQLEKSLKERWEVFELYEKTVKCSLVVLLDNYYGRYVSDYLSGIAINKAYFNELINIQYYPADWNKVDEPLNLVQDTDYKIIIRNNIPCIQWINLPKFYTGGDNNSGLWLNMKFGFNEANLESIFADALMEQIATNWKARYPCSDVVVNTIARENAFDKVIELSQKLNRIIC